jgi:hypothetical protein
MASPWGRLIVNQNLFNADQGLHCLGELLISGLRFSRDQGLSLPRRNGVFELGGSADNLVCESDSRQRGRGQESANPLGPPQAGVD